MEVRYIKADDDRVAISKVYEESWKYTYRGIIPQDYLGPLLLLLCPAKACLAAILQSLCKQLVNQLWIVRDGRQWF